MLPCGCFPVVLALALTCARASKDPVEAPAAISGEDGAVVTGELGRSLNIRCPVYGFPAPSIYWYHDRSMLPYSSEQYEATGNVLQIHQLSVDTVGEYSCQAYDGNWKAALWTIVVRAHETEEVRSHEPLVPRGDVTVPSRPETQATTTPAPEIDVSVYTVTLSSEGSGFDSTDPTFSTNEDWSIAETGSTPEIFETTTEIDTSERSSTGSDSTKSGFIKTDSTDLSNTTEATLVNASTVSTEESVTDSSTKTKESSELSNYTNETVSTGTTESGATESKKTTELGTTESGQTSESGSTDESTVTGVTDSTDITDSAVSGTTVLGTTDSSNSTESSNYTDESTGSSETDYTDISTTETSHSTEETSKSSSTESLVTDEITETESTTPEGSTKESSSGSSDSSEPTESSTVVGSTDIGNKTSTASESTDVTTESGSTGSFDAITELSSTSEAGSTISNSTDDTTKSGSTESAQTESSGSTDETTETGYTEVSGSTETIESGSTESTESDAFDFTSESGSTEPFESTGFTTESGTEETGSTTTGSTEATEETEPTVTEETGSTGIDEYDSTEAQCATGPQMESCVMSCNSSAYGCCPDGKTPAHGYDNEGCCLLYAFECCPDNFKPADGPHLESCGCQYAHFGCCPDNATIARGPAYEGCGCEITQHGCCPDRHTPASGPNFEGCDCATFQFGCCDDGVTVAKEPGRQDCLCQQSEFGCCGDETTLATGPGQAGCDCATSKYGCCPDGQTPATGSKFLGCTDKPENRQAACSLTTDRGPCTNYSLLWYYDMEYGGCSRFWYGGCEGNGNRFSSKEECEDVCVQPAPKDACQLPKVKGACEGYHPRWYYDSAREKCGQFIFGGCLGNANNFNTRELCETQCKPTKGDNQCSLAVDGGECAGNFPRWGFDAEFRRCSQFVWGGCDGNTNRFRSEQACLHRCHPPGAPLPECNEPQDAGNCTEKQPAWSFSQPENRCMPFYYTGCGGNGNRFDSQRSCAEACPSSYVKNLCTLPAQTGECAQYSEKWYYDTAIKRCRQFYYGGCGGNGNRFASEQECEARCRPAPAVTQAPPPASYGQEICFLDIDAGPCTDIQPRWAYDSERGGCVPFGYGGCGGNHNNFPNEAYCQHTCGAIQDICHLPMLQGPCEESVMQWFYDPTSDACSQFNYGGCQGNGNRFKSVEACERRCRAGPEAPAAPAAAANITTTLAPTAELPSQCVVAPSADEECPEAGEVWYLDVSQRACAPLANAAGACRRAGTFASEEACERTCGAFRDIDLCKRIPKLVNCIDYAVTWFFDESRDECFSYGSCDLSDTDRFTSREQCEGQCRRASAVATTSVPAPPPPEPVESQCATPVSLAPCGGNVTVFYYDAERRECAAGMFDGCGYANSYRSEEECQRRCGAFQGLDPCRSPLDVGLCGESIPKFYWKLSAGRCEQYAYSGCGGGPNRFSTHDECEQLCGPTGPDLCKRIPKLVNCIDYAVTWFFDESRDECFSYGSCDLSDTDRFTSREQCEGQCRRASAVATTSAPAPPPPEPVESQCATPASLAPCGGNVTVFYYDAERRECAAGMFDGCGYANSYRSEEECQRRCGAFQGLDPCRSPLDVGLCGESIPKFYWKLSAGRCEQYAYSGCGGGPNRFSTHDECEQLCGPTGPVPVNTSIPLSSLTAAVGAELSIPCEVEGYPPPDVYWTKDGAHLQPAPRLQPTEARLTISLLTVENSGVYGCHASNEYGSHSSTIQVNVQGLFIPVHCTDNPFFADCQLIVRSKFCRHHHYSKFCCKSCVEAGQLNPQELGTQAD